MDNDEHVETVCLLLKLNAEYHIEVEVKMDDMDLTAAEKKATYDEIKAYVLEYTGLKVSSLCISQIKRKCGLEVGQNYNLSKKIGTGLSVFLFFEAMEDSQPYTNCKCYFPATYAII